MYCPCIEMIWDTNGQSFPFFNIDEIPFWPCLYAVSCIHCTCLFVRLQGTFRIIAVCWQYCLFKPVLLKLVGAHIEVPVGPVYF